MEISIKDILKVIIKKWYIVLTILSLFVAIGTSIAVSNYNKPKYTASSSFLFTNLPSTSNINLYVGNAKAYLVTDFVQYNIKDEINELYPEEKVEYDVNIESASATLTITVSAPNEDIALSVLSKYSNALTEEPILRSESLEIHVLVPPYPREQKPSLISLGVQIALFAFIGLFIGSIIILTPLYSDKAKEERLQRIIEEKGFVKREVIEEDKV